MEYRVERKYICTEGELVILEHRLAGLMERDEHLQENGIYTVRSLYFDDYQYSNMRENEDGVNERKKFRIRIYNADADRITLEVKYKKNSMTKKEACPLTRLQCETILAGGRPEYRRGDGKALHLLYLEMTTRLLHPVVIVEYERTPLIYRAGNVRVTFDRNIAASDRLEEFLEEDILRLPIMPSGRHILEVKYDEFLPDGIAQALELGTLTQTAFSKYRECMERVGYAAGSFG